MLKPYLEKLMRFENLSANEIYAVGKNILAQNNIPQISSLLSLLKAKGETQDEIFGMFQVFNEQRTEIDLGVPSLDIVGTGGDGHSTINISTSGAMLASMCGVPIIKHGNRAVSSKCGSADLLEALGYPINLEPKQILDKFITDNFGFCFAPNYNTSFKQLSLIRHDLGYSTIFNLLGPLLNPVGTKHILLGVNQPNRVEIFAQVLCKIGTKRSLVFHGYGLDELSCIGPIDALMINNKVITPFRIDPEELGLKLCCLDDLKGGAALYNAKLIYATLKGADTPIKDTLILNAATALFIYGLTSTLEDAIHQVRTKLEDGSICQNQFYKNLVIPNNIDLSPDTSENYLAKIVKRKLQQNTQAIKKSLKHQLLSNPNAIIGEIKRASPSRGKITSIQDPVTKALSYIAAGVAAISVLTDEAFEGSMIDLKEVANALKDLPQAVLCKDFILTPLQIAEAANSGADAILLIVAVLKDQTASMIKLAHDFGLETLVEVHNADELAIALSANCDMLGVNQRNLNDFSFKPKIFVQLINLIPPNMVKVAESGIKNIDDANYAFSLGYDAILVGEALSSLKNPGDFFKDKNVN